MKKPIDPNLEGFDNDLPIDIEENVTQETYFDGEINLKSTPRRKESVPTTMELSEQEIPEHKTANRSGSSSRITSDSHHHSSGSHRHHHSSGSHHHHHHRHHSSKKKKMPVIAKVLISILAIIVAFAVAIAGTFFVLEQRVKKV